VQAIEKQLKELSTALHSCRGEKKQLEDERQEHIKQRAKMELDLKDLEDSVNEDKASKVSTAHIRLVTVIMPLLIGSE